MNSNVRRKRNPGDPAVEQPHVAAGDQVELNFGDERGSVWAGPYVVHSIRPANDVPYRVVIEGVGACAPEVVRRARPVKRCG